MHGQRDTARRSRRCRSVHLPDNAFLNTALTELPHTRAVVNRQRPRGMARSRSRRAGRRAARPGGAIDFDASRAAWDVQPAVRRPATKRTPKTLRATRYNPPRPSVSLAPGSRLGPYEVVAPIGAGGMGHVYRARDSRL